MTVSEANAFNTVCRYLGLYDQVGERPTAERATEAFALLAERSSKALMAGVSGGNIVARRRVLEALGQRKRGGT